MRKQTSDQLALCSWSLRAKTPSELIDSIRQTGINKVQLHLNPLRDNPDVWGAIHKQFKDAGIEVVSGMFGTVGEDYSTLESIRRTGGVVPDETWDRNWRIIQDVAAIAADMGLSKVSMHSGFLPHESSDPNFAKLVGRIKQIADCFAASGNHPGGITLLFETGQETSATLNLFLDALQQVGVRNVAVNFDPANMILYDKGEPVSSLRQLLPRVRQVHIKDARRTQVPGTWGAEVAVGEGEVAWPDFLSALAQGDYAGHLVIEREAGAQRVADIQKAATFIRALMA